MVKEFVAMNGLANVLANLDGLADRLGGNPTWVVGTNVHYAVHQELGTSRMSPNPFLRPAVEYARRNIVGNAIRAAPSLPAAIATVALGVEAQAKHYATTGVPPGPDVQTGRLKSSIRAEKRGS